MEAAIRRARDMVDAGVDIIDIGGQSTRPHAARLPPEVELQRIMPVISCVLHCCCGTRTRPRTQRLPISVCGNLGAASEGSRAFERSTLASSTAELADIRSV